MRWQDRAHRDWGRDDLLRAYLDFRAHEHAHPDLRAWYERWYRGFARRVPMRPERRSGRAAGPAAVVVVVRSATGAVRAPARSRARRCLAGRLRLGHALRFA